MANEGKGNATNEELLRAHIAGFVNQTDRNNIFKLGKFTILGFNRPSSQAPYKWRVTQNGNNKLDKYFRSLTFALDYALKLLKESPDETT